MSTHYVQIEKELLVILYAGEHFQQYTFGWHVTVLSDHRSLKSVIKKDLVKMIAVHGYDITVFYHLGKRMYLADTLSKAYIHEVTGDSDDEDIQEIKNILITERRLFELQAATKKRNHTRITAYNI